ncbi:hypothetical protein GH714_016679 [Hevea brasiliensis]|uniref:Protein kinase domain-containing protein n=1 Tax=Hevea brasiliensis TaxID=3981 RepID=A0A6A6K505_HEVBR|nr:hypothetical protein GH714_016679 [Hevea brasiliensis]
MASSGYSAPPPPVFSGEGYSIWSVKMKAYLKAFDLWEVTETGRQPGPLREDPTLAQLKAHSEECAKGFKALSCIHSAVSDVIFTRIMACETAKQAWDRLKEEFHGSESSKQMSVLNLRREFEVLKMKESETLKEYTDRLMSVVNKIRLLGGFHSVHKGRLTHSNMSVAVTKYLWGSKLTKKECVTGMKIISQLKHRNLLQLVGWCHEEGKFLLVYELLPNGSLDSHLFGNRTHLTCDMRYRITHGLASALVYLHEGLEQRLVHGDVKSSNIMLDSNFNAKLCDFGLARFMNQELVRQNAGLAEAEGYMAPEYISTGEANKESDVYGFGLVALEIATGRRVLDPIEDRPEMSLVEWVWDHYRNRTLGLAVDRRLNMDFDEKQMECLMIVGLWCAQPDHGSRPSIRQAIHVLNFDALLPNLPIN